MSGLEGHLQRLEEESAEPDEAGGTTGDRGLLDNARDQLGGALVQRKLQLRLQRRHGGGGPVIQRQAKAHEFAGKGKLTGDYARLTSALKEYLSLERKAPAPEQQSERKKGLLEGLLAAARRFFDKKVIEEQEAREEGSQRRLRHLAERVEGTRRLIDDLLRRLEEVERAIEVARSARRIEQLRQEGTLEGSLYHGSHSGVLNGIRDTGTLKSGAQLHREGVVTSSGEGDFFSSGGGGPKEFISVGKGEHGLGTVIAYAEATGKLKNYNVELYSDPDLAEEVRLLTIAIDNYDPSLIGYEERTADHKTKPQLEGLRAKLQREQQARANLPPTHPRRAGQPGDSSSYPLLFEIDGGGLDVRDDGNFASRENPEYLSPNHQESNLGERMVHESIDLKLRLVRVYCPVAKMGEVRSRLQGIVGHSRFEVLAMEALDRLPQPGWISQSRVNTFMNLRSFERIREETIKEYAVGMRSRSGFGWHNRKQLLQQDI